MGNSKKSLLVDPSMDKLADEIFYFDGFDYKVGETHLFLLKMH